MSFDAAFAALLGARLGTPWGRAPHVAHLDARLRRDVGLPPVAGQPMSFLVLGLR